MICGIHVGDGGQLRDYMKYYTRVLDKNHIPYRALDVSDSGFWHEVREVDLFIYRWAQYDHDRQIALTLIPVLQRELGIKCYPDESASWPYDDKIRQQYLFAAAGFPMAEGWVFYDLQKALRWIEHSPLPLVFKLRKGAASENVVLVRDRRTARGLTKRMFGVGVPTKGIPGRGNLVWQDMRSSVRNLVRVGRDAARRTFPNFKTTDRHWEREKNYVYFQKFLPGNDYDTRVTVIGDRAFAFRRWVRRGDFRASGSGRIDYSIKGIDLAFVKQAFAISKHFYYKSMAYDFLYDEERRVALCEASYTYVDQAVYRCPGHWNSRLEFQEGHLWPAYCQLKDALEMADLKPLDENLE
jgi:hypothetical protein